MLYDLIDEFEQNKEMTEEKPQAPSLFKNMNRVCRQPRKASWIDQQFQPPTTTARIKGGVFMTTSPALAKQEHEAKYAQTIRRLKEDVKFRRLVEPARDLAELSRGKSLSGIRRGVNTFAKSKGRVYGAYTPSTWVRLGDPAFQAEVERLAKGPRPSRATVGGRYDSREEAFLGYQDPRNSRTGARKKGGKRGPGGASRLTEAGRRRGGAAARGAGASRGGRGDALAMTSGEM